MVEQNCRIFVYDEAVQYYSAACWTSTAMRIAKELIHSNVIALCDSFL
jgi:hypothetical protein